MKKESYYFSHDYNASRDPKIIKLLNKLSWAGYGMYWHIIELLHEQGGKIAKDDLFDILSYELKLKDEEIKDLIELLLTLKLLFLEDNKNYTSARVLKNLQQKEDKKAIKAEAGKKAMEARYGKKDKTGDPNNETPESSDDSDNIRLREDEIIPEFLFSEEEVNFLVNKLYEGWQQLFEKARQEKFVPEPYDRLQIRAMIKAVNHQQIKEGKKGDVKTTGKELFDMFKDSFALDGFAEPYLTKNMNLKFFRNNLQKYRTALYGESEYTSYLEYSQTKAEIDGFTFE